MPMVHSGPSVLDVDGITLATAAQRAGVHWTCAIRPGDGAVLLGEQSHGLTLWDWRRDSWAQQTTSGTMAVFADEATFYFRESSSELWRCRVGGKPELVVRVVSDEPGAAGSPNWVTPPIVSTDARHVFVRMTVAGTAARHVGVFVDVDERRVQRVDGFHSHSTNWF